MKVLISEWGFRLPMASAILTVLYPQSFTVYDVRVCEILKKHSNIQYRIKFENLWSGYEGYISDVKSAVKNNLSLRDNDRYMSGKSLNIQLKRDIKGKFKKMREEDETDA